MNPAVFREYDIRGSFPDDLNRDSVQELGLAVGSYYLEKGIKKISLGRDCRLSSPELRDALSKGLTESGLNVVDVGMVPTPLLYFSIIHLGLEGGVQITGSHNPPEYNGFKICLGRITIHGEEIQEVRKIIEGGNFCKGSGSLENYDIIPAYLDYVKANIRPGNIKRRIIVDAGNGVGGLAAPGLYASLGVEVESLFCDPDGRFPNHHPDPIIPENLDIIIEKVRESYSDLGFAFDGDADRIVVVDNEGKILWGDQLMIIFARDILKRNPGAKIIGEVKCTQLLFDDIKKHGGVPIMWKAGHSLIKSKMNEERAIFGGEITGHLFFADRYFGYDDAIYAGARLLEIVTQQEKNLGELLSDLPPVVNSPEIRVDCPDDKKFLIAEKLGKLFKKEYDVVDIDGARVLFEGGWGLVRASNTQPALGLRFEAQDSARLSEIRDIFMDSLKKLL